MINIIFVLKTVERYTSFIPQLFCAQINMEEMELKDEGLQEIVWDNLIGAVSLVSPLLYATILMVY